MATPANPTALAQQARQSYVEGLLAGLPTVVQAVDHGARVLVSQVVEPSIAIKRRELVPDLKKGAPFWLQGMLSMLRGARQSGMVSATRPGDLPNPGARNNAKLSLVDDDTIEQEIISSRLALAMMDKASWEFTDLRSRMTVLEGREELDTNDALRPHVFARIITASWRAAGLTLDTWRQLQGVLHEEFAHFSEEGYHEANRFLLSRHVLPDVDLRPFIRRSRNQANSSGYNTNFQGSSGFTPSRSGAGSSSGGREVGEETRMMTRAAGLARGIDHAEAVLGRLNRLIGRQLPGFGSTQNDNPVAAAPASPRLKTAINNAQADIARRVAPSSGDVRTVAGGHMSTPALLEELNQPKQALKQAATTPV